MRHERERCLDALLVERRGDHSGRREHIGGECRDAVRRREGVVLRCHDDRPDQRAAADARSDFAGPSLEDLLATKLKAILDRAEAKDYRDIAAMLSAGVALERGLGGFAKMFGKDPGLALRAIGFFKDGDLPSLAKSDQDILRAARDRVTEIPEITLSYGSLAGG